MSFHCPNCDAKTQVTSTRAELRQRKCHACGLKFLTEETEYDGKMLWERPHPRRSGDGVLPE